MEERQDRKQLWAAGDVFLNGALIRVILQRFQLNGTTMGTFTRGDVHIVRAGRQLQLHLPTEEETPERRPASSALLHCSPVCKT